MDESPDILAPAAKPAKRRVAPKKTAAKKPVVRRAAPRSLDADIMDVRPQPNLTLGEQGLAPQAIETPSLMDLQPGALELAAFMEEEVEIYVQLSKGERREVPVTCTVNGIRQHVFRGVPQRIKRKYLEPLARSITVDYDQDMEALYMSGDLPRAITSQTYPFSIIQDTPRGIEWLRELQMRG